jgi:hypothetical protein
VALENTLRILTEITLEPFSDSHFVERIEHAHEKAGNAWNIRRVSQISRLDQVDEQRIRKKQKLFKSAWEEINMTATKKLQRPTSTHAIVKANLNYYLEPAFLQGVMIRTNSIVDSGEIIEASNYLKSIFFTSYRKLRHAEILR